MKITNETCADSNYSSIAKDLNQRNFPLLKFKENLYNICQSKFSKYINNKKADLRLMINNKTNQQISINDYYNNSPNDNDSHKLTPIPSMNKRKIKNEGEKKELKNFQRNVVLMRRLEYANKMKEKNMKKKYKNKNKQIILLQKFIRGFLVRKVINQVNIINETLTNFLFLISFCIKKKYFYYIKDKIASDLIPGEGRRSITNSNNDNKKTFKENINENDNFNNLTTNNNEKTNRNDCINDNNEYKLTHNEHFYGGENNHFDDNLNINDELQKLKEKINIIDSNINEINKEDVDIIFNVHDKTENTFMNYDNKQDKINTDFHNENTDNNNNNNINNNIANERKSMALINAQLNELKNKTTEENIRMNTINNNNINLNMIKKKCNSLINQDSVIENDEYIDFSGKHTLKPNSKNMSKNNKNSNTNNNSNNNPNRNPLNYIISEISTNNIKKDKTEIIQRQFRKYLCKKGYYGKFDKKKMVIIYLLKNKILNNIRSYVFNNFILIYKEIKIITMTQEDIFFNIPSERIENVKQIYNCAINHLNFD